MTRWSILLALVLVCSCRSFVDKQAASSTYRILEKSFAASRRQGDLELARASLPGGVVQLSPHRFRQPFARAKALAGRPDLTFHALRHTGAVLAAASGATIAELMARLGHTTPAMAMRYQHAAADRDRVIADALSRLATGGGDE